MMEKTKIILRSLLCTVLKIKERDSEETSWYSLGTNVRKWTSGTDLFLKILPEKYSAYLQLLL